MRRLAIERLLAAAFGLLLALAATELVLRVPRLHLPPALETSLFQCYASPYPDQNITFHSDKLSIQEPRPAIDLRCAWQGYRWHHHGDRFGYRNWENASRADVVMLGDSTVYGHGVEESSIASHFLRQELHAKVVNLGVTGDSPVEYLARLRTFGLPLKPRVAIVFFFQNDLDDILKARTTEQIHHFIDTGEAPENTATDRDTVLSEYHPPAPTFAQHLLSLRALRFVVGSHWDGDPDPDPESVDVPDVNAEVPLEGGESLAIEYLRANAAVMARLAREAGTHLVFSVIPTVSSGRRQQLVRRTVAETARSLGLPFIDLIDRFAVNGRITADHYFLPHDFHLNEEGHRRVATEVASFLRAEHLLERHH